MTRSALVPIVLDLMRRYPEALRVSPPGGSGARRRAYAKGGGLSKAPEAVRQRRGMIRELRRAGATRAVAADLIGVSVAMVERAGR